MRIEPLRVVVDLADASAPLLWVAAGGGLLAVTGLLFWIMPLRERLGLPGLQVALGMGGVAVAALLSRGSRGVLWFIAVGSLLALPMLMYVGRLPADMPPAWDPRSRSHPEYQRLAARGRLAGGVYVTALLAAMIASAFFVRGI